MTATVTREATTADVLAHAPSPAWLAARAIHYLATAEWDQTKWGTCVGSVMAHYAGFKPGKDEHHAHTGDTWWVVLEALIGGPVIVATGHSVFAPEAASADIVEALQRVIIRNPDRTV